MLMGPVLDPSAERNSLVVPPAPFILLADLAHLLKTLLHWLSKKTVKSLHHYSVLVSEAKTSLMPYSMEESTTSLSLAVIFSFSTVPVIDFDV